MILWILKHFTSVRHLAANNLSGAERQLEKLINGSGNAGLVDESIFNNLADDFNPIKIPALKNENKSKFKKAVNLGIEKTNEKLLEPTQNFIKNMLQGERVGQRRAKLFLDALSADDGAGLNSIIKAVKEDPSAFSKIAKETINLTKKQREIIIDALKDTPEISKVLDSYEERIKKDFGDTLDTLDSAFNIKASPKDENIINANQKIVQILGNKAFRNSAVQRDFFDMLKKPQGLKEWQKLRWTINSEIDALSKNLDAISYDRKNALESVKNIVDEAMENIINKYDTGGLSSELLSSARKDYQILKELEDSDLYKKMRNGVKNDETQADILTDINSIGNTNGLNTEMFLSSLGKNERANVENALIRSVINKNTKDNITNFKNIIDTINALPLQTKTALSIKDDLNTNAVLLNNSGELLSRLKNTNPKLFDASQGISKNVFTRQMTKGANRLSNIITRLTPFIGDDKALKYNINQAIKNSPTLELADKNIDKMIEQTDNSNTRELLQNFKNKFDEVIDEFKKIELNKNVDEINGNGFVMKDGSERAYSQLATLRPNNSSINQNGLKKLEVAREKLLKDDISKLNDEQKNIYEVFIGKKDKIILKGKDLNDLYSLEQGSRNTGAKKNNDKTRRNR